MTEETASIRIKRKHDLGRWGVGEEIPECLDRT